MLIGIYGDLERSINLTSSYVVTNNIEMVSWLVVVLWFALVPYVQYPFWGFWYEPLISMFLRGSPQDVSRKISVPSDRHQII